MACVFVVGCPYALKKVIFFVFSSSPHTRVLLSFCCSGSFLSVYEQMMSASAPCFPSFNKAPHGPIFLSANACESFDTDKFPEPNPLVASDQTARAVVEKTGDPFQHERRLRIDAERRLQLVEDKYTVFDKNLVLPLALFSF